MRRTQRGTISWLLILSLTVPPCGAPHTHPSILFLLSLNFCCRKSSLKSKPSPPLTHPQMKQHKLTTIYIYIFWSSGICSYLAHTCGGWCNGVINQLSYAGNYWNQTRVYIYIAGEHTAICIGMHALKDWEAQDFPVIKTRHVWEATCMYLTISEFSRVNPHAL